MTGVFEPDPEYVAARRVLLEALEALGAHRDAVVLVGAQAIYLQVGEGDLAVAPFTTDADLVIDSRCLDDEPELVVTLEAAAFELARRSGTWQKTAILVDFLVPASLGGPGRRGARLGAHGNDVARKATGLEAAVVDHAPVRVRALDPSDARTFDLNVAGVAALLVAKLHKIHERRDDPARRQGKDALDVLRLLRFADPAALGPRLAELATDPIAGEVTRQARGMLGALFGRRDGIGAQMAVRASAGLEESAAIAQSCEVLAGRVMASRR